MDENIPMVQRRRIPPAELTEFIMDSLEHHPDECIDNLDEIPADWNPHWVTNEANLATLRLDGLNFPHEEVHKEILACAEDYPWVKHRGDDHPDWMSLVLHGQSWDATGTPDAHPEFGFAHENCAPASEIFHYTEIAKYFPRTIKWLEEESPFHNFRRVRFMLLKPGGWILPHTDYEEQRLGPCNIAVYHPKKCGFYMEGAGEVPWQNGDVRLIDVGKNHGVYNNSDEDRIHIIVHADRKQDVFPKIVKESFRNQYINR